MSDDPILAGLANIQSAIAYLQIGIAALQNGQTALQNGQTALQTGQTALRVDVMARMDRLQNSLTSIQEDIQVNFAHAEKAIDTFHAVAFVVRSQGKEIAAMQRQMQQMKMDLEELRQAHDPRGD